MSDALARRSRIAVDPITVEVIGSALSSITEEMGEALVRASYSTNIKERRDCSTALFNTRGDTLCQAEHIPMHLGSFIGIIPHILKRHPVAEMRPGDVFVGNDAYEGGGTHLPDIVLAEPIFVDGADRRLGGEHRAPRRFRRSRPCAYLPGGAAHPADPAVSRRRAAGGRAGADPAELPGAARAAVGPARADGGEPAGRAADARRCAPNTAARRCSRRATRCWTTPSARCAPASRRSPTAPIAFADRFDNPEIDGELRFSCEITVAGDEMHLHFDAPDQVRAGINMVYTALLSTVYYAVKTVVDPTILPNAGLARPLHVDGARGQRASTACIRRR